MRDHVTLTSGFRSLASYFGVQGAAALILVAPLTLLTFSLAPHEATVDELAVFVVVLCTVHIMLNRIGAAFIRNDDVDDMIRDLDRFFGHREIIRRVLFAVHIGVGFSIAVCLTLLPCLPIYGWLGISWASAVVWRIIWFCTVLLAAIALIDLAAVTIFILRSKDRRLPSIEMVYGGASAVCARYALPADFVGLLLGVLSAQRDRRSPPDAVR